MKKFKAEWGFSAPTDVKPPKKKLKLTPEVIEGAYNSFEPNLKKIDFGKQELLSTKRQPLRDTINTNSTTSMIPVGTPKQSFDLSSAIALGLSGISALIPSQPIKNPVVQPYENYSYNANPYGTGSQALMKKGGKIKCADGIKMKYPDGGKVSITNQHRTDWNNYVSWLDKKKLKGSPNLDKNNYGFKVLEDYRKENPTTSITKDMIIPIQQEFSNYRKWSLQQIKDKQAALSPGVTEENYMRALSIVDGIPGQRTTSFQFPESYLTTFVNNKNEGTVNQGFAKTSFKNGGVLKTDNINIENDNYKQISPSILELTGDSHANGGVDIDFMGKMIEAEKGEPITLDKEGNLTIFGDLKNPLTNNKYKKDAKVLAKKENKAKVYFDRGLELINTQDPKGKYSSYAFNAGKVMMEGGKGKLDEISKAKEHLGELQNAHLQLIGEEEHTAKNGKTLYAKGGKTDPPTKWKFNNTNTKGLDEKIMEFVKIAEAKGLGGYSGPQSGISQRNTKSGKLSRHAQKQALDMIFSDKDVYNKILNDPDLSGYLINNGLTAINEYDPSIARKTGATTGHIHIGYDNGTETSDKFRQDAKAKWASDNPNWKWNSRVPSTGKPLPDAPAGDMYDFPPAIRQPFNDKTGFNPVIPPEYLAASPEQPVATTAPSVQMNNYQFDFTDKKRAPFSNAKPLDLTNVLGEAYSLATNQQEPVFMQQYQPDLYQDYQVSFQDRVNQNNRTFNASQQLIGYNPQAMSVLSSELYNANNQVAAEEFRTNQAISNDITNKNISLLNDAKGKNLQLADTQYVRQSQAKSNTKAINQEALNSISAKVLQNQRENNTLRTYENLYPDFRFDKNYQKQFVGAPASEVIDWGAVQGSNYTKEVQTLNPDGSIKQTKRTMEAETPINLQLKREKLREILQKRTTPNFDSGGKINVRKWLSSI